MNPLTFLRDLWRGYSDADLESACRKMKRAKQYHKSGGVEGKREALTEPEARAVASQIDPV